MAPGGSSAAHAAPAFVGAVLDHVPTDRHGAPKAARYAWEDAIAALPIAPTVALWLYSFSRLCKVKTGHLDLRLSHRDLGRYWGIHPDSAKRRMRRMREVEVNGRIVPLIKVEHRFSRAARGGEAPGDTRTQRANDYTLAIEIAGLAPEPARPSAAAPPRAPGRPVQHRRRPTRLESAAPAPASSPAVAPAPSPAVAIVLSDAGRVILEQLRELPRLAGFATEHDAEELAGLARAKGKTAAQVKEAIATAHGKARDIAPRSLWSFLWACVENQKPVEEIKPRKVPVRASVAAADPPPRSQLLGIKIDPSFATFSAKLGAPHAAEKIAPAPPPSLSASEDIAAALDELTPPSGARPRGPP